MPDIKSRIAPLLPPEWNEDILNALGAFPGGLKFVQTRWEEGGSDARGMHLLGTFARHPDLARAFLTFNNHLATSSSLLVRDREMLILRLAWLRKAEYEYYQHTILGLRAGLTEAELEQLRIGPDAPGWSLEDAQLVRAVDELVADACISDATWEQLSERFSLQQMMDLVFLVGCYEIVATTSKSFGITAEPDTGSLAPELKARMQGEG